MLYTFLKHLNCSARQMNSGIKECYNRVSKLFDIHPKGTAWNTIGTMQMIMLFAHKYKDKYFITLSYKFALWLQVIVNRIFYHMSPKETFSL